MDCKRPEPGGKAGKIGEVGLLAPSHLAHSPAAQRGGIRCSGRTRSSTLELWFFRVREKCALAKKFSHAETFDVGLLYFWPAGQRYLGVNPLPRSRHLKDFGVCVFSQRAPDFRVAGIFPPFSGVNVNCAGACGGTAGILPSLNDNFPIRKTVSSFVQGAEQTGPSGGLLRSS
jgi:hypothetical protein